MGMIKLPDESNIISGFLTYNNIEKRNMKTNVIKTFLSISIIIYILY